MITRLLIFSLSLFGYAPTEIGEELQFNIITASGKAKSFSLVVDEHELIHDIKKKIAQKLVKLSHGSLKEDTNFILVYRENLLEENSSLKDAMEKNAHQKLTSLSQETIAIIAFEPQFQLHIPRMSECF